MNSLTPLMFLGGLQSWIVSIFNHSISNPLGDTSTPRNPVFSLWNLHLKMLSHSICISDYFHFQPDTPNTPECHPHYAIHMTTSINSESIINNTVGSINFISAASET